MRFTAKDPISKKKKKTKEKYSLTFCAIYITYTRYTYVLQVFDTNTLWLRFFINYSVALYDTVVQCLPIFYF